MKIRNINVDGFGVWKGLTVDDVSENMTVFYGRNEAGKTTLMQFVRAMMYGFSDQRRSHYTPPIYGGLAGGSIKVDSNHGGVSIQRHVDPSRVHSVEGDMSMIWEDGRIMGQSQLAMLTSGIDEPTFSNVFAIGLREIQELAMLDNTDAAEQLYRLTSGLDRVSLVDVMKDLKSQRESVWHPEAGRDSKINSLLTEEKKLRREIDELVGKSRRWSKVGLQSAELEDQLTRIDGQVAENEATARVVELAVQIRDRWNARRLIDDQIEAMGTLPDERHVSAAKLDELNQEIAELRGSMDQNRQLREDVSKQAKELPINRLLWKNASRIDALQEHGPWIDSLERQISRKRSGLAKMKNDINGHVSSLSSQFESEDGTAPEISSEAVDSLRSIARDLKDEKKKLAEIDQEHELAKDAFKRFQSELNEELKSRGCDRLIDSIDDSGKLVNRLRRRVELTEQIDSLELKRKDTEHDIDAVMREQVLPPRKLFWLGVIVVVGFVLILSALVESSPLASIGPLSAILGVGCLLFAAGLKFTWDQYHRDELENCQHQMDVLRQQSRRALTERDELDKDLPQGIAHHDTKLRDTETELLRLQDLVPLEARNKAARQTLEDSERRVTAVRERVEHAARKWKSRLRSIGLPEELSPNSVRDIATRSEKIASMNHKVRDYRDDLQHREQELVSISERVRQLVNEVGLKAEDNEPKSQLILLADSLVDQRKLIEKRKDFAVDYRKLRSRFNKMERQMDSLLGSKSRMLGKVGAESEEEFREFSIKHDQLKSLWEKRRNLDEQIAAAIGLQITEEQVGEELDANGGAALEKRWENLLSETERLVKKRAELQQQRGEFIQEMKTLAEDRRMDEARLELNMVSEQIKEATGDWQVSATTGLLLESIRESYEAERQPETLNEASQFLSQLTGDKYNRIWTKLTENCLLVDNADGESLAVEKLSRGTREAVYLALRMALVTAYARRGTSIPMVLDDVLVNFDAERARNAATALRDFANRGYQVMMFTCHDHIRELFLKLDVDVLDLPSHVDVVEHGATVTRARWSEPEPLVQYIQQPPVEKVLQEVVVEPQAVEDEEDTYILYEEPAPEPAVLDDTELYYEDDPRPTLYVDGRETELRRLEAELRDELSAVAGELRKPTGRRETPRTESHRNETPRRKPIDYSNQSIRDARFRSERDHAPEIGYVEDLIGDNDNHHGLEPDTRLSNDWWSGEGAA